MNTPKHTLRYAVSLTALIIAATPALAENAAASREGANNSDIRELVQPEYMPKTDRIGEGGDNLGDHMATMDLMMNGKTIRDLAHPTQDQQAATKWYVDQRIDEIRQGTSEGKVTGSGEGDNLGDGVARSVVNMNGYNITNLSDPFFDGDAVNLRYFNDHAGDVVGGDISNSSISNSTMTNSIITNSTFEGDISNADITNSTFQGEILNSTVDSSTITNTDVSNSTFQGGITNSTVSNTTLSDITINDATIADSNISNVTVSDSIFEGAEMTDVTIDGGSFESVAIENSVVNNSELNSVTINEGDISNVTMTDTVISGNTIIEGSTTLQGDTVFEGPIDMGGNAITNMVIEGFAIGDDLSMQDFRITNVADPVDGGDAVNLNTVNQLIQTFVENYEFPALETADGGSTVTVGDAANDAGAEAPTENSGGGGSAIGGDSGGISTGSGAAIPDQTIVINNDYYIRRDEYTQVAANTGWKDDMHLELGDDSNARMMWDAGSEVAIFENVTPESPFMFSTTTAEGETIPSMVMTATGGVTLFENGEERLSTTDDGAAVNGGLAVSGPITGVTAQYRETPSQDAALGLLMGSDVSSALGGVEAMVYALPDGTIATGINPESLPKELSFIMQTSESEDGTMAYSIDYSQLIGPMIVMMRDMQAEIDTLKAVAPTQP